MRAGRGGSLPLPLVIPSNAALVGASLYEQAVVLELGAGGIQSITSTNALLLVLGMP